MREEMNRELVTVNVEADKLDQILTPEAVTRLELGPNDIVVIQVEGRISDEAAERIKTAFGEGVGLKNKIAVVESTMKFGVIRKTA